LVYSGHPIRNIEKLKLSAVDLALGDKNDI